MNKHDKTVTILMAEDDPDDRLLARDALDESQWPSDLHFVEDGEELLNYLHRRGKYLEGASAPRPNLIVLDLNMPRKDGREALREIKTDPNFRQIPIVVLSTSSAAEDIYYTYDLGANSFITKPVTFESLVDLIRTVSQYWFETVELPPERPGN